MTKKINKRWMQSAVKKKGSFTAYCKRHGYKKVTQTCINKGKKSNNPTTRRRAILAQTFRKYKKK